MASQPRQFHLSSANSHSTSADTTFTKIFVGGLAWETQRDKMQLYFEQFGEILEAVVITDKHTGRSKGYGFVTFKTPEAAARACFDPSPVIDGRQANCNLASLGATHRPRFGNSRFWPPMPSSSYRGSSFFHQPPHYASLPYSIHGFSDGYSQENMYPVPMSYYGLASGGQQQQISPYYLPGFYPYYTQYTHSSQAQGGFGLNYPQMLHYPYAPPPHLGSSSAILSFPATTAVGFIAASSSWKPPGSI